ncbi:Tex-like protein N-terminal domain-containing protein [Neorhodopirellula lusitana]|uniref:Tex-like protein N-terminal domain-containing protein n=1 Tax=Neorhodopirellula lusitana TaxID=445327 RepID=A0ABY1PX19_9BACT|nr:S1 RNA-binding domain-containing protein [Neorhodopirellula lusitana]SMP47903.1 Tex-like protein N-terminal domain-containing protein [Neorhodopirellula lusitana]
MNVDLDAIAQRGRCEVSSLRLALPLIEQGYTPPFLARYRRDELGGLDEGSLWALSHAVRTERRLQEYRDELHAAWQATSLADPTIGRAVSQAKSRRLLDRLARRIKNESGEANNISNQLAVRVLNPQKGDGEDLDALAQLLQPAVNTEAATGDDVAAEDATAPAAGDTSAAVAKIDEALARRLSGDPRVIGAAVRWLSRNAKIHIIDVSDPHGSGDDDGGSQGAGAPATEEVKPLKPVEAPAFGADKSIEAVAAEAPAESSEAPVAVEAVVTEGGETEATPEPVVSEETKSEAEPATEAAPAEESAPTEEVSSEAAPAQEAAAEGATAAPESAEPVVAAAEEVTAAEGATEAETAAPAAESAAPAPAEEAAKPDAKGKAKKPAKKEKQAAKAKKAKKISPRQRRRRWLVSTLKPLAGKKMPAAKLSAFQVVMLGRALRSQVAQCAFDYDATKLVAELQKTVSGFNRNLGERLAGVLLANEAAIRDAAEGAWWDEIQEQASARLVSIAAEHLNRQINRGGVEAKVIMSIDAVGPRTAATAIVSADGRLLHSEDIPCQLSAAMRTLAVTKMGELIHKHHVDLIVISNGPARRACMIAVGELIKQSNDQSVRWTLADRSGADAYAGSPAGDQEMKQTPRRFRSAAWIAFATLKPSQAMVKVDPLKLRLGSFQRELPDQAVLAALEDVLVSGMSRGGVDVNSTTSSWLERLPGMNHEIAETISQSRREKLVASRDELLGRVEWPSEVNSRQALPFLRVFSSAEPLDGTLIHPDDYPLAKRLATALEIELPPECPPGYELPDYSTPQPKAEAPVAAPESTETADVAASTESTFAGNVVDAEADSDSSPATETEPEASSDSASSPVADASPDDATASETPEAATDEAAVEASSEAVTAEGEEAKPVEAAAPEADAQPEASGAEEAPAAEATEVAALEPIRRTKPEKAKVDKLVKEWQVGVRRSYQIVNWLCDPFGDGMHEGGEPPAVMTSMPSRNDLKQGDRVIGVVVGVMPFGVFVELSPECSGLIHVSRISDGYVEDLHEAVQVGDVVTAWVTGIDSKRRRVGLSAVSPEREAELTQERQESRGRGPGRGQGGGGQRGQQGAGQGDSSSRGASSRGSGQQGSGQRGAPQRGGSGQGNRGGGRPGGGSRGGRDGGRRDSRGGSRGPRRPEVYEVVGKEPDSPTLTNAMQEGKEPMRSFGDLMQMFTKEKAPAAKPSAKKPAAEKPAADPAPANDAAPAEKPADIADTPPVESAEVKPAPEASGQADGEAT